MVSDEVIQEAKTVSGHSKMVEERKRLEEKGYSCSRKKPDEGMSMKLVCTKGSDKVTIQH